jgi:RHS repeat-associated protein
MVIDSPCLSLLYAMTVYTIPFTPSVNFAYQTLSGDGSIVARVVGIQGSTSAQAGVMIRETSNTGSTMAYTAHDSTSDLYCWYRTTTGGQGSEQAGSGETLPYWVELTRSGNVFTYYWSMDGVNWVQVGATQTISMAQNVSIGLGASSGSNTVLATATFDNVSVTSTVTPSPIITGVSATTGAIGSHVTITGSGFGASQSGSLATLNGAPLTITSWSNTSISITIPAGATSGYLVVSVAPTMNDSNPVSFDVTSQPLPSPWLDQDIGQTGVAGSATFANETFTVNGAGTGIYYSSDEVHFVYQALSGDGSIVARLVGLQGSPYARAGVMIRETLNSGATVGYTEHDDSADVYFWNRPTTGASATDQGATAGSVPYWVGLTRSGNNFVSYLSADGVNWTQVGTPQTLIMAQNVFIGLAVSSDYNTTLATATFDHVSVSSDIVPAPFISTVSATTGPVGSTVIISGNGFGATQNGSVVTLNGVPVTINSWSSGSITITIPTGATSGPLLVTVAPTMNSSNAVIFTITAQPLPSPWLDQDIGAVGIAGSATFASSAFKIAASGQGVYTTVDQVHFVYQPLSGDGSIVARVASFQGANYPEAGTMIRESLEPNSSMVFISLQSSGSIYLWNRASTGASTTYQSASGGAAPYWVKLTRTGSNFSGYTSSDGANWAQVGTTQTISMPQNVFVGLAVYSDDNTLVTTAAVDHVSVNTSVNPAPTITNVSATTGSIGSQVVITGTGFGGSQSGSLVTLNASPITINSWSNTSITATIPSGATTGPLLVSVVPGMNDSNYVFFTVTTQPLPSGWLNQDVGSVGVAGNATYTGGVFTVNGSGQGVFTSSDQFQFAYQPLLGDGSIVACVTGLTGASSPLAGVMIRETLLTGATSVFVAWRSTDQVYLVDRPTAGTTPTYVGAPATAPPYWVKLVRSGGTFTAYMSANGTTWVQVGTTLTISMAQNVYIGLAVTSDDNTSLSTATFSNVTFTPGNTPNVASLSPYSGGVGTSVTINGTDFGSPRGSGTVTFNGLPSATITSWTNSQIVATVPSGIPEGPGPVVVTANSLPSNSTVLFTASDPVISNLEPPFGPIYGQILVNGTGFGTVQGAGTVQINGFAGHVISWSDTSIDVQAMPGTTSGPLTVTVNGFTSPGVQFTVIEGITVTSISPTSGLAGTSVTINGTGFGSTQSDSVVAFYGVPATTTAWTDTQITATVPAGAATGPITVEVAANTATGPSFLVTMLVTLTDSLSHQSTYASEMIGGKWYVNNAQGSGCSSCTVRGSTQFTFDNFGNILTRTDPLGHVTSYTYDANQNMLSMSVQANSGYATTSYTYNSFAEPLTITDPLNNTTTNTYDPVGNLLTVTTPSPDGHTAASVTQFAYNSLGEMTQITDPLGHITKIAYTSVGLIYTITDAQNNVTTYAYDSRGNRTSVTDAMTNQTTFAYDSGSRLTTITYPGNATTVFAYDYRGRRTSVTDQNSKKTTYAYDDADRLTSVTDPNNNVTNYSYDTENNLLSIEDANTHTTSFTYDAFGRVMETTFPSTHYEQYGYDAANNLTSKTDRKGQTINYVYDDLYRLTQKTYPDSSTVEYVYDLVGKLQQVTDPTGTYGFAYDNMGRLVGSTTKYTFLSTTTYSNAYTYDANSNRASMTDPQNGVTSYIYDTLNRLSTLTPPTAFGTGSFGFTYDALSRRTQMTRPNGVTSNYTYNNLSQLLSVLHQVGASTIDGAVYTVDPAGNRTAKTDEHANVTSNYTYDPLYELTQVMQSTTTTESYSFDPVGNRLSSLGVSPYSVNASNELTAIPGTTYTYDSNGNTLTKVTSSGTTTFGWDYENRLTGMTLPGTGGTLAFKYDGLGRRVQKAFTLGSTTTTTNYLYDVNNAVADVDQSGNVLARYVETQNIDEFLAELRSTTTSYYSQDGLGSVTSLTTSAGGLANTYTYDSFGKVISSTGSIANRFQYTGREFDSETGLYYYRARYYDSGSGRFLTEDPIVFRAGINFYRYARNNPVRLVDPSGQIHLDGGKLHDDPAGGLEVLCRSGRDLATDIEMLEISIATRADEIAALGMAADANHIERLGNEQGTLARCQRCENERNMKEDPVIAPDWEEWFENNKGKIYFIGAVGLGVAAVALAPATGGLSLAVLAAP